MLALPSTTAAVRRSVAATPKTYTRSYNGHLVEAHRTVDRFAYARNGNTGNPTCIYQWSATVGGRVVVSGMARRSAAFDVAAIFVDSGEVAS